MESRDFPFNIMDVASLLHLKRRREGPNSIYVDCPFCGDQRGKMNLNYVKNVWRCNYCQEKGGMLALYARVHGISNSDAYQEIFETLVNDGPAPGYSISAAAPKEETLAERASPEEMHRTYSALLSMLTLTPAHWEHLRTVRGLTKEQVEQFGFRSTPQAYQCQPITETLMRQGYKVKGVPGFYIDDRGRWTVRFHQRTSGILIPILSMDGRICGLQTRLDHPIKNKDDPPDKAGMKYLTLSTTGKNMGASSGSPVHFIGDPCSRVVYVTEGVLKAYICHALTGRTFAATLGANNVAGLEPLFETLKKNGTEEIIEAEDMDKYSNKAVNTGASKIYVMARNCGLRCSRLTWNPNYKGMDDWQIAMRRKLIEGKEERKLSFKEQYLSGLCTLDDLTHFVEKWHELPDNGVSLCDYLGLTEREYTIMLQGDAYVKFEDVLNSQRHRQGLRIYQLDLDSGKTIPYAFSSLDKLRQLGYEQPRASDYALVHSEEMICPLTQADDEILHRVFTKFNDTLPEDYAGRSISTSDVVELYGDTERKFFYRESDGFTAVSFSPMLVKKKYNN